MFLKYTLAFYFYGFLIKVFLKLKLHNEVTHNYEYMYASLI